MRATDLPGRVADGLTSLAQAIACGLLAGMFVLINFEVLCRYLFSTSTLLADEYSAYFFALMVYLGLSHSLYHDKLIKIDLPRAWAAFTQSTAVRTLLATLGLGFNLMLVYAMYLTTATSVRFQSRSIQPSQTLLMYPQWAVVIALGIAVVVGVIVLLRSIRSARS